MVALIAAFIAGVVVGALGLVAAVTIHNRISGGRE